VPVEIGNLRENQAIRSVAISFHIPAPCQNFPSYFDASFWQACMWTDTLCHSAKTYVLLCRQRRIKTSPCNCDSGGWRCRFLLHVGEVLLISLGKSETCAVANVYAPKSIAEKYSSSLSYSTSSLSAPSILILLIWGHSCCSLPLWTPSHPCLLLCTNARRPSSETWPWTAHSLYWTDSAATQCCGVYGDHTVSHLPYLLASAE